MKLFKLVVFDLEGTLVKHTIRQSKIIEESISKNGVKLSFQIEPIYYLRALSEFHAAKKFVKEVLRRNGTPSTDEMIASIVTEYERLRKIPEYLFNLQYLFPGTKEMLWALKQKGIKLAILTNSNQFQANYLLQQFGIAKYFDLVVDDSCGLPEKPSPARLQMVLEKIGVDSKDALMVGDSGADIEAGKAAGTKTCGVLTGNSRKEDLEEAKADYILESVKDFVKVIN